MPPCDKRWKTTKVPRYTPAGAHLPGGDPRNLNFNAKEERTQWLPRRKVLSFSFIRIKRTINSASAVPDGTDEKIKYPFIEILRLVVSGMTK